VRDLLTVATQQPSRITARSSILLLLCNVLLASRFAVLGATLVVGRDQAGGTNGGPAAR
jgi:hypothetical protein